MERLADDQVLVGKLKSNVGRGLERSGGARYIQGLIQALLQQGIVGKERKRQSVLRGCSSIHQLQRLPFVVREPLQDPRLYQATAVGETDLVEIVFDDELGFGLGLLGNCRLMRCSGRVAAWNGLPGSGLRCRGLLRRLLRKRRLRRLRWFRPVLLHQRLRGQDDEEGYRKGEQHISLRAGILLRILKISQTFLPRGGIRGIALLASHSLNYRLWHHGIVSALHEGVATKQTKRRHRTPAQHAETLNRFLGILRASGDVTAGGQQPRRQQPLINSQERDDGSFHLPPPADFCKTVSKARPTSFTTTANSALRMTRFGFITTSIGGALTGRVIRTASRIRRRMRLRSTAPPSARLTVKPMRRPVGGGSTRGEKNTVMLLEKCRFPSR